MDGSYSFNFGYTYIYIYKTTPGIFNEAVVTSCITITTPNKDILKILHGFIRSPDILVIMASAFLYAGIGYTSDIMEPIVVLEVFNWKTRYLIMKSGFTSMGMIFINLFLSKYSVTNKQVYTTSIVAIILSFVNISVLAVITLVPTTAHWQIVLTVLYAVTV